MKFEKGRSKTGGRKKGTPYKISASVKDFLFKVYEDEAVLILDIERLRKDRDPRIRLEIVKLAVAYQFGKPVQPIVDEDPPPLRIDISAIPRKRERVG